MMEYNVSCLHKGRKIVYVASIVSAENEKDALIRFMNWHDKQYKHRRAYDVQCAERPTEIHFERLPRLGIDENHVNMDAVKAAFFS